MPINAKPVVLDKFWLSLFSAAADLKTQTAVLNMRIVPYNANGDSSIEIVLDPIDVFSKISSDPEAAEIYQSILNYALKEAVLQGKLTAIEAQNGPQ